MFRQQEIRLLAAGSADGGQAGRGKRGGGGGRGGGQLTRSGVLLDASHGGLDETLWIGEVDAGGKSQTGMQTLEAQALRGRKGCAYLCAAGRGRSPLRENLGTCRRMPVGKAGVRGPRRMAASHIGVGSQRAVPAATHLQLGARLGLRRHAQAAADRRQQQLRALRKGDGLTQQVERVVRAALLCLLVRR